MRSPTTSLSWSGFSIGKRFLHLTDLLKRHWFTKRPSKCSMFAFTERHHVAENVREPWTKFLLKSVKDLSDFFQLPLVEILDAHRATWPESKPRSDEDSTFFDPEPSDPRHSTDRKCLSAHSEALSEQCAPSISITTARITVSLPFPSCRFFAIDSIEQAFKYQTTSSLTPRMGPKPPA